MTRTHVAYRLSAIYLFIALVGVGEMLMPGAGWPVASMAVFAVFLRTMNHYHREAILTLFAIEIAKILMFVSIMFIGAGVFVRELAIVADQSTYSAYYSLTACLYVHAACLAFKAARQARGPVLALSGQQNLIGAYALGAGGVCLVSVLYLIFLGLRSGFPMLAGLDRFAFRAEQDVLFDIIINFKPILAGLMGMIRFRFRPRPLQRRLLDCAFGLLLGTVVLFGEKFLSLLVMGGAYALPYLLRKNRRPLSSRLVAAGMSMAVLMSSATWYVYSDYGALGASATSERLLGRFTGQGQLWYAAINADWSGPDFDQLQRMGDVLASSNSSKEAFRQNVGIFYLISRFAPSNVYDSILSNQGFVQFTGGYEAYLLTVGGHLLMIAGVIAFGAIAGLASFYVYESLVAGAMLGQAASLFIYWSVYSASNQASLWQVLGVKSLLYFAIIIVADRVTRPLLSGSRNRKRPNSRSSGRPPSTRP